MTDEKNKSSKKLVSRLLARLHKAERLSESFMQNLLSRVHPGFSVYAGPPVEAGEIASLEAQAQYMTRPALAMEVLEKLENGNLVLETPARSQHARPEIRPGRGRTGRAGR